MNVNDVIHGFILKSVKKIDDIASTLYEFEHQKSGANLVYLENEDTNKCFSIGFRTLPEDSTGICHIIEHSLLCGSQKYPLKEPFVNLLKGSMSTFLNAMTAYDWTMYPVASQNDKDFNNLMGVYLDAIFAPLSIIDEKPFLQEGWHVELNNVDDIPSLKGVVYNEMKGAMSNVNRQLGQATNEAFYKGTCYEYNSGGDPDVIPSLTYKYYQDFYKKHYNPDNGLMYLYGKMDLSEKLKIIDEEYLSKYERSTNPVVIPMPKPLINTDYEKDYAIAETEEEKDNTYISLAFALDPYEKAEEFIAMGILDEALMSTNDSPLKKILMDAKLGQDIATEIDDDCILPSYSIFLQKTNKEEKERFYTTFLDACKKLVTEGIDKKILLATINNREFRDKEMDLGGMPKGLFFAFSLMQSYLYNVPYENYLEYTRYYNIYRKELNNNYFEKLIEKYFLNSKHYVEVVLNPSKSLEKKKAKEMEDSMLKLKESMTKEEKEKCVRITKELYEYQSKKDTKEELATLPTLSLDDITSDVNTLPCNVKSIDKIKVIERVFNTNKIGYLKLYFDLSPVEFDELPYVNFLSTILGEIDTESYSAADLQSNIMTYFGKFSLSTFYGSSKRDNCEMKLTVNVSALQENIDKINHILDEVLNKTIFDKEKIKIRLTQLQSSLRNVIIGNGMAIAMDYSKAPWSVEGAVSAKVSGYNMYTFITDALANYDNLNVPLKLKDLCKRIFTTSNLYASISGDQEVVNELSKSLYEIKLSNDEIEKKMNVVLPSKDAVALVIPSGVSYNAESANLDELNEKYSGKLNVLGHIIRYDYLWPEIRVKGGAYGCSITFKRNGDVSLGSYRDPNVQNTYDSYDNIITYLEGFDTSEEEFMSYLIGAIGSYDKPLSNNYQIIMADYSYLMNVSDDDRRKFKEEMKNTTIEDIKNFSKLFKLLKDKKTIYTVGNNQKISEYNKFQEIKKL